MRLLTYFIKYNDDDDNDDDVRIPFMIQIKWDRTSLSASMYSIYLPEQGLPL